MQRFKILFLSGALLLAACGPASPLPQNQGPALSETLRHLQAWDTNPAPQTKIHLCGAMTKTGKSCRRRVKNEGDRCYLHRDADTPAGRRRALYVLRGEGGSAVL